jgi:hypothetical protein
LTDILRVGGGGRDELEKENKLGKEDEQEYKLNGYRRFWEELSHYLSLQIEYLI